MTSLVDIESRKK